MPKQSGRPVRVSPPKAHPSARVVPKGTDTVFRIRVSFLPRFPAYKSGSLVLGAERTVRPNRKEAGGRPGPAGGIRRLRSAAGSRLGGSPAFVFAPPARFAGGALHILAARAGRVSLN